MTAFANPNPVADATFGQNLFHAPSAYSGVTVPIYSTTTPTYALWNPLGSGRIMVPVSMRIGVEATGTAALASLGLVQVLNTTAAFATGLPIATWSDGTVYNGRVGRLGGNQCRFATSLTLTTAGTFFYHLNLGLASVAAGTNWLSLRHDFSGELMLEPGNLVHLAGVPVAPGQPITVSTSWIELDLNGNLLHTS